MTAGFYEFEFDLPGALLIRLVETFAGMPAAPLEAATVSAIPDAQGVYELFLDEKLIYIGKTDAEAGLRKRLFRHSEKIQHRVGLDPARVTFRAIRVFVFTAVDLETQLIKYYETNTWNGSGFGSNDPGRERDTTSYKEEHYDAKYPIDIDRGLAGIDLLGAAPASEVFDKLRKVIPYTFRCQNRGGGSRRPHPDLDTMVTIDTTAANTARRIIEVVVPQLPHGWQATKLPSHLILYKETRDYPSGTLLASS